MLPESSKYRQNDADNSTWGLSYTPSVDDWTILYKGLGGGKFISDDGKTAEFGNATNAPFAKAALTALAPLAASKSIHITKSFDWQKDFENGKSLFAISTVASFDFIKNDTKGALNILARGRACLASA